MYFFSLIKRVVYLFFIIVSFTSISVKAESIEEINVTNYVNDYAGFLSSENRNNLNLKLQQLEASTTNQFVVVTVNDLNGDYIENYAIKLFEKIKPGLKDKDNGVLLLISKTDRKVRLEVGYGLEGVLTDGISSDIINKIILPNFKSGQFEVGIISSTEEVIKILSGEIYEFKKASLSKDSIIVGLIMIPFLAMFQVISTFGVRPGKFRYLSSLFFGSVLGVFPGTFFGKYGFLSWLGFALLIAFIFRNTKVKQNSSGHGNDSNYWGGGGSSWGGGSGGGFSGGGGRSGGGGASGGW